MPRLFVALDFPLSVREELVRIQPRRTPGLRLGAVEQMHLTLHFIGEAEVEPVIAALTKVACRSCSLQISGIGKFPPVGRATVLWAGVPVTAELLGLHAAVGAVLAEVGFRVEARPYAPHITLARCGPKVAADVVEGFLDRNQGWSLPAVEMSSFALYSSVIHNEGPVYRCEQSFPLLG